MKTLRTAGLLAAMAVAGPASLLAGVAGGYFLGFLRLVSMVD